MGGHHAWLRQGEQGKEASIENAAGKTETRASTRRVRGGTRATKVVISSRFFRPSGFVPRAHPATRTASLQGRSAKAERRQAGNVVGHAVVGFHRS
jgi:hypothetical protein